MQRYERYKDSGIEWLGEIPSHWRLVPNKYIFEQKKDLVGKKSRLYQLLSLTLNGIIVRNMENPQGKFPAEFDTYQEVNIGDFVFCHFDVEETPRTVGLSNYKGMITGAYTVYKQISKNDSKFLYYWFLNLDLKKRLKPLYKGLRNTISKEAFGSFYSFIPPVEEQSAIARFLDEKCEQIDRAVAQKERVIELLNERRQIVIQRAVTRGLNPDVPLRDSGIDWIGQIPAHWQVTRLKNLIKDFESGVSVNASNSESADCFEVGVLKTSCVYNYIFDPTENKQVDEYELQRVSCSVKKGNIIISRMNTPDLVGASGYVSESYPNLYLPDRLWQTIFYDDRQISAKWLSRVFITSGFRYCVSTIATGSSPSMKNISQGDFLDLRIPYPSFEEQEEIANYLDKVNEKIDRAVALKSEEIEKLKEYKQTLINSAVTGKIKIA